VAATPARPKRPVILFISMLIADASLVGRT
jgi:hypothetical protein